MARPRSSPSWRWRLTHALITAAARSVSRLHVTGTPHPRPTIYAAAHVADGDILAVLAALHGVPLSVVASQRFLSNPVTGLFVTPRDLIPVNLRQPDGEQVTASIAEALRSGRSTLIYPEGRYTSEVNRSVGPLRTGMVRAARAARVPVVPVVHTGTEAILGSSHRRAAFLARVGHAATRAATQLPLPPVVNVNIGKPISVAELSRGTIREATNRVRDTMNRDLDTLRAGAARLPRQRKPPGSPGS